VKTASPQGSQHHSKLLGGEKGQNIMQRVGATSHVLTPEHV